MVEMGNMSDGRNPNTEAPCLTSSGLRGQGLETKTAIYSATDNVHAIPSRLEPSGSTSAQL